VAGLRTALAYSHESFSVRLRLAEALAAAKKQRQAQAYLQALWEEQPGNATVNLELARIAVAGGDVAGALRYYHGAIYGVWDRDPFEQRRTARLELIAFLLQRRQLQEAESELIAVTADLPRDPNQLVRIGGYFLQAGDTRRALEEYTLAARIDPQNAAAFRGAAQAALREQQFADAQRYAQKALKLNPDDAAGAELLRTIDLVVEMDPTPRGLSLAQRAARVARALEQAQYRLETCAARNGVKLSPPVGQQSREATLAADYTQLLSLKPRLRPEILRREPDLLPTAMDVVFRSESDAEQHCGAAAGVDEVLLLLGRRQGVIP
jgi:tetratricopeptide (TPR) repeat protein